jgi:hypothetical protein
MAGEVKIGVSAGVQGVDAALKKVTDAYNKLGQAAANAQKMKFEPASTKDLARDLSMINVQFKQAIALSAQLRNALKTSGQSGLPLHQVDFDKAFFNPKTAQNYRNAAFRKATQGTSLDFTIFNPVNDEGEAVSTAKADAAAQKARDKADAADVRASARADHEGAKAQAKADAEVAGGGGRKIGGGGGNWRRGIGGAGRALGTGLSSMGGMGELAGAGIAGAADSFGAGAGVMGTLGGGLAGVALGGIAMAGQFIGEGIGLAKQQNEVLDLLKRQMGDVGVSFEQLTRDTEAFSKGLGIANGDFAKLEMQANSASGGAYGTPDELGRATRGGADLARAYGLDPSQGVGFMSGMRRMNSAQDDKRLAIDIAEAISNAQGHATPGEVMQAMMGFAASQNRFNGGQADLNRFGNAYASLMNAGATSDRAQGILSTANSAMQGMGGTEASQNFTMQAFGTLDPVRAQMRAEGGIFGNGLDSSNISAFMRSCGVQGWDQMDKGPSGTNADAIVKRFDDMYAGRGTYGRKMEINGLKRYFNFKSYDDTAAFANMKTGDHNGILSVLQSAGVDLSQVREGGLQGIAAISRAGNANDLQKLWDGELSKNPGITTDDRDDFTRASKSGSFQDMQKALVRIMSGKGQSDDAATVQRSIDSNIADIKTSIGEKLIPITQAVMQSVRAMANKIPGVNIDDPLLIGPPKSAKDMPGANARVDQTGIGAAQLNAIANKVDAGNSWADSVASKVNYAYGQAQGLGYQYNGATVDGMQQLAGMGIDKAHSAAIMASAVRESSMNPAARSGNMYGLFQFDKGRQKDFQTVMGKSIIGSSAREQIEYMVRSMQAGGEEAGPGKGFWSSSGADAAGYFARKIERTDHPGKESDIRKGIADQLEANITINFEQHNTSANGSTTVKKMSTTVSKPMATGLDPNLQVFVIPPSK